MMQIACNERPATAGGIRLAGAAARVEAAAAAFLARLETLGLAGRIDAVDDPGDRDHGVRFRLKPGLAGELAPAGDTTELRARLGLAADDRASLKREILLAMLLGPVTFEFPSYEELDSAVRIRALIVEAARRTTLDFRTSDAERPAEYWTYAPGRSFTVLPGKSLLTALRKATQPEAAGPLYSFSCYRATEYVILLGIVEEAMTANPELFQRLQSQWETRAIMSGEFHEVFLREYGSMAAPLPVGYYVPGDRLWFRNPDERSSDVTGYEGSWVFYLGGGLFTNFWKRDRPYTLTSKCVELYHWRNAARQDAGGQPYIEERIVEERVAATLADAEETRRVMAVMMRLREPKGVYVDGGCIDTSREYPRCIRPGTAEVRLPGC